METEVAAANDGTMETGCAGGQCRLRAFGESQLIKKLVIEQDLATIWKVQTFLNQDPV